MCGWVGTDDYFDDLELMTVSPKIECDKVLGKISHALHQVGLKKGENKEKTQTIRNKINY